MILKLARRIPKACYFIKTTHVCFKIFTTLKLVSKTLGIRVSLEF